MAERADNGVKMDPFPLSQVNHFVLAKHHLIAAGHGDNVGDITADVAQTTGDIAGLHATGATTPYLSLLARMADFQREQLSDALYASRDVAKIRCVRKTIYIHPRDKLSMIFAATSARVITASERYMAFRGVSAADFEALSGRILAMLAGRMMTAQAIKTDLHVDADVSAILYTLCDRGLLLRDRPVGDWKDKSHRYSLFHDAFPDVDLGVMDESEAIAALVGHYLAAFGPALDTDLFWWTGLGKRKVQAALKDLGDQVRQVMVQGFERPCLMPANQTGRLSEIEPFDRPVVNLLTWHDPYLMGYADRHRYLDPALREWVFDRSGNVTATVLVNGRVLGVWDYDAAGSMVKLHFLNPVGEQIQGEIIGQARRLGRFMTDAGAEVAVGLCGEMIPLTRRTAGSFMVPLKDSEAQVVS